MAWAMLGMMVCGSAGAQAWSSAPPAWASPSPQASPLSPEVAFATRLQALDDGQVRLIVQPAPGYQVDPAKVSVRSASDSVGLGAVAATAAASDRAVWLTFPVVRQSISASRLTVDATFQGCQGPGGVCYPPQHRQMTVLLPPRTVPRATVVDSTQALEQALASSSGPVVVEAYADWCSPCRALEASLGDTPVQHALTRWTWLRLDVSQLNDQDQAWLSAHGAPGLPAVWVLPHGGAEGLSAAARHLGEWAPGALVHRLASGSR